MKATEVVLAALLAAVAASGCASGSSGDAGEEPRPIPEQRRNVVRVSGYQPVELMNQGNLDVSAIPADSATVWIALGGVYSQLEIPVTDSDPRELHLGNRGYPARRIDGQRMNAFVDCGNDLAGPIANQYDITLTVYSRLTAKGPASTELATVVDAYGRPRAVSGNPMHCNSRGRLEELIAKKVAEALGLGGG